MKKVRNISTAGFICFFGFIPYFFLLKALGDSRVLDKNLAGNEMNIIEQGVLLFGAISVVLFWFYALYRAYADGRMGWLIAIFFFFPVYPIYFWLFTEK